jgi:hypothetical protein
LQQTMKQLRRAIQVTLLAVLAICAPAGAQPRPPDVGVLLARLDDLYRIVRVEINVTTPRSTRWFGHRRAIRDVDTQRQMVGSVERLSAVRRRARRADAAQSVRRIAAGRIRADPRVW